MGNHWAYREAYGHGCITKMGLVYPLIEDDVSNAYSVDIHFKFLVIVKDINKELLIHFLLSEDIRKTKENLCDLKLAMCYLRSHRIH